MDVNETLHDETETPMPQDETETYKNASETLTSQDRDVDRDALIESFCYLLAYYLVC